MSEMNMSQSQPCTDLEVGQAKSENMKAEETSGGGDTECLESENQVKGSELEEKIDTKMQSTKSRNTKENDVTVAIFDDDSNTSGDQSDGKAEGDESEKQSQIINLGMEDDSKINNDENKTTSSQKNGSEYEDKDMQARTETNFVPDQSDYSRSMITKNPEIKTGEEQDQQKSTKESGSIMKDSAENSKDNATVDEEENDKDKKSKEAEEDNDQTKFTIVTEDNMNEQSKESKDKTVINENKQEEGRTEKKPEATKEAEEENDQTKFKTVTEDNMNEQSKKSKDEVAINENKQEERKTEKKLESTDSVEKPNKSEKTENDNKTDDAKKAAALAKLRRSKTNDDDDYDEPSGGQELGKRVLEERFRDAEKEFTFFWKTEDVFSQWHPSKFTVGKIVFTCAEQFMMYQKATLFGSDDVAIKILKTNDPREMKALGRKVKQFKDSMWCWHCIDVVKNASWYKYTQNKTLKEILFSTYPRVLVEASPFDRIWGIGLVRQDERAWDKSTWEGQNLLGYILTEVRDELMYREKLISAESRRIYTPELQEEVFKLNVENDPGTDVDDGYFYDPTGYMS